MSSTITIAKAPGKWVVRAGGAVIGETENALELIEEGVSPVIYFPRDDIEMAFLEPSETVSVSPEKGRAMHYAVVAKSGAIPDIAWSYEEPSEATERVRGYIAFRTGEKVAVEQI
ncbi:DUF427 domain-containing protein [Halovulum dunhuangense]|uniref:DUF427 domain-containing protein n=1 Tax=Halovulum dunhuangense TaxID=1505036 RepID=A0A849L199_9RHOB|nr:DUF427 domain-containing protein [Halovulum dunhuangense]NNU80025.1 DUF427 domain-containing protein [Halovulum dunhuangense]